jgi:hypothetical protein
VSVEELEAERIRLVDEIQAIEVQLANPNKTDDSGERLTDWEYHDWRQKAVFARSAKLKRLREVKRQIVGEKSTLLERMDAKLDRILEYFEEEE